MVPEKHDRFERYSIPELPFSIDRELPRCISECPAFCDAKGYLELIAEGKYNEAYNLIVETIPLPATMGRICERPCENGCKRSFFDESVGIRSLKKFVADKVSRSSLESQRKGGGDGKIAIIGSGPGGLTAATDLSKKGYDVTILEKEDELGGMLRYIPEYKLPMDILDKEIGQLLDLFEIEIEKNCEVGSDVDFDNLTKEYEAVLIATGLPEERSLDLEGSDLDGIDTALSFLDKANSCKEKNVGEGDRVLVIGGGNTAINSARVARRLGAEVKVVYRRSEKQMPASERKVKEAEEEGIDFVYLASPSRIVGNEKVQKAEFDLMKLGKPDKTGRRRPIPIDDSNMTLKADYFIWAIGQKSDVSLFNENDVETDRGIVKVNPVTLETNKNGVFAAGDIVRGPASAAEAIGDGHRAAKSIDRFLQGTDLEKNRTVARETNESDDYLNQMREELRKTIMVRGINQDEKAKPPKLDSEERKRNFDEVEAGLSEDSAINEAKRCLACKGCQLYPTTESKEADIDIREYIEGLMKSTDVTKCIDCGECTGYCPITDFDERFSPRRLVRTILTRVEEETEEVIQGEEIWKCTTCGICNTVCPYDVDFVSFVRGLREKSSREKSAPRYSKSGMVREKFTDTDKLSWLTEELEVSDEGDVYYFTGCIPYLDWIYKDRENLNLVEIPRNAVKILNSIGITPVISPDEVCCGHDLIWRGEKDQVKDLAKSNIEAIKETGAETVVFTCPEGLRTFKKDYKDLLEEEPDLKFVHLTEFLKGKEVSLRGTWDEEKLTYHDDCRSKHLEMFDEPRAILKKIPNTKMIEMENIKEKAPCCGVNAMSTCNPISREMQTQRLNEAIETGADKLIVSCPKCWIHLDCELSSNYSIADGIEIEELTTFLGKHLTPS